MGICTRVVTLAVTMVFLLRAAPARADLTVEAPPGLEAAAERLRSVDLAQLDAALGRAGLARPDDVRITLIADDDPRARGVPGWIVGLAFGERDVVIFPGRVVTYPYDSLESVVRHEVAHLALNAAARGADMPRWFHEGVATSVDAGWGIGAQVRLAAAFIGRPAGGRLDDLFAREGESEMREAYLLSAVLVNDLRRRHGDGVAGAIARRMGGGATFDGAFAAVTSETPARAAETAWGKYRRWTAWIPAITSASAAWAAILVLAFVAYATQMRRRWRRRRQWDEEEGDEPAT